jgi:hypothetical protein
MDIITVVYLATSYIPMLNGRGKPQDTGVRKKEQKKCFSYNLRVTSIAILQLGAGNSV